MNEEFKKNLIKDLQYIKEGKIKAKLKVAAWDYLVSLIEEDLK